MRKITLLLLFFTCLGGIKAQGLQFNQWQYAPALLNPALAGGYEGTFRVGGIIKEKWQSVGSGWKTFEGFVDAPIIRGLRKQDWIGVGLAYAYDLQGNMPNINSQIQRVSLAYHLGMGTRKLKRSLAIGFQFGNTNRKFDYEGVETEQSFNPMTSGSNSIFEAFINNTSGMQELATDFRYFGAGFAYQAQTDKTTHMSFGLNVSQFLKNNKQNFVALAGGDLETRFTGFFAMKNQTSKRTTFEPQIVFTQQGKNNKLYTQAIFGYLLKNKKMMLKYGAGINTLNDDFNIPIYLGIEKGNLRVGLAYDVDLGAIAGTSTYGGLELAASYIHVLAKKPEPKRILICPRL